MPNLERRDLRVDRSVSGRFQRCERCVRSPGRRSVPVTEDGALLARGAFDAWNAHVAVLDEHGKILLVNDAWDRFARDNGGSGTGEGADYFAVCAAATDDPVAAAALDGLQRLLAGTSAELCIDYRCHGPAVERWFRLSARRLLHPGAARLLVVHEDVTDRKRLQDDARARSLILDEVDAAVVATDLAGLVTLWTRGAERLFGWTAEQAIGRSAHQLVVSSDSEQQDHVDQFARHLMATGAAEADFVGVRRDGATLPIHNRCTVLRDPDGSPSGSITVSIDLSDRRAIERKLGAITDAIGDGLCTLDREGRITFVNPPGLRMLRTSMAEALGGSFMQWVHSADQTRSWVARASPAVECQMVRHDGTELAIEYVAIPLDDRTGGGPGEVLVVFRDVSVRSAQEARLADQEDAAAYLSRIAVALDDDGFVLHAQPIVDLATRRTVQHELLLRMRDPDRPEALILPGLFLPTAEAVGVAPAIDRWVLSKGLGLAARGIPVEINLSATSLDDSSLPTLIQQLMAESDADPADVVFEVTETALLEDLVTARRFADLMHNLGCRLALDDFGTGYGGFTYLKNLPVDILKIDIEFVRDAVVDKASRHVISAVVSMAQSFGMTTVAEGVEDDDTLTLLSDMGVDHAQGYLLGRPEAVSDLFAPSYQKADR